MNEVFYNSKYTVITNKPLKIDSEKFINFHGNLVEAGFKAKSYEINNDTFFSGNIIINNLKKFNKDNSLTLENKLDYIVRKNILTKKNIFLTDVFHDGIDSKCFVNDNLIYCSSWVLPYVTNSERTNNNLYGDLISRRIKIEKIIIKSAI